MTTELALLLALAFGCGLIAAVALLLDRRVSVGPRLPRPPAPPPLPSCSHCGKTMERAVALPTWYVDELMARGMPAPDYVCCERGCTVGGCVVYCYAVNPGEPVRLGRAKPAPEEEV
jgi:hypothetical protein